MVWSNATFAQVFAHAPGTTCFQAFKGRDAVCEPCLVDRVFADGREQISEEEGLTSLHQLIHYHVRAIPLPDAAGNVEHVLLISTDTTRATELEQALSQVERLAHAGLSAVGLAHTIKNIVGGMDGALWMVDTGLDKHDSERMSAGWKMLKSYLAQVSTLVKNLLEFARPGEHAREAVVPKTLVDEVIALHRAKAAAADIAVDVCHDAAVRAVWMDRQAVLSSLSNLLTNAIDACTWDPDIAKEHRIRIATTARPEGGVVFSVADNGTGVSVANQQRLLRTLFTTKGIRGTGLGLLLTKKVMQDHEGRITFSTTPGQGSEFCLELPAGHPKPSSESEISTGS
jgi:histidine kinase